MPLRAANARTLIEQSIGRGLRLPYGKRTGVTAVDRLNIVAHDRFQEIVEEANNPNSTIRLQQVVLNPDQLQQKTVTVVSQPQLAAKLGLKPDHPTSSTQVSGFNEAPAVFNAEEQKIAQIAYDVIRKFESQPEKLPSISYLQQPEVQAAVLKEVTNQYRPAQMELTGITKQPDLAAVVAKTHFSCCGADEVSAAMDATGRDTFVVAGVEAHVCVYQTARDLAERGRRVVVATDAVLSRTPANLETGLRLMERTGALLSSTEAVLFDLLGQAGTPEFKAISALVK